MPTGIFLSKYTVLKVLSSDFVINCYIANKNNGLKEELYLVNEICQRELINIYMPEIVTLKQENLPEYIEYFSENSKLYVVFRYTQGQSLDAFLNVDKQPFEYRALLIQKVIYKLTEYPAVCSLLKSTALVADNIVFDENLLSFNFKMLQWPEEAVSNEFMYKNFSVLLAKFFSKNEFEKYPSLNIIFEKSERAIYHSFGEMIKDFQDVFSSMGKEEDIKEKLEQKKNKAKVVLARVLVVAVIFAGGVFVYQKVWDKDVETAMNQEVDAIGTVPVTEDKKQQEAEKIFIENSDVPVDVPEETPIEVSAPMPVVEEEIVVEPPETTLEPVVDVPVDTPDAQGIYTDENGVKYKVHVVTKGESLTKIIKNEYGNTDNLNYIRKFNDIQGSGSIIYRGQQIKLPIMQ